MTLRVAQSITVARYSQPLPRRDIGNVARHLLSRRRGGEVTVHQVGDRARLALPGGGRPPRPGLAGDQAQLAHQGTDQLQARPHAPPAQLPPHSPVPVGPVGIVEGLPDQYAAAFFRNAFSISSSRFCRSSSRSRARSDACSGGSSSSCFSRHARTQLPSDVLLIPSSRATSAIGRDVSTTSRAASSRNSGE